MPAPNQYFTGQNPASVRVALSQDIPALYAGVGTIATQYPYNADNTGSTDTTAKLQAAITGGAGGDIVLPAGTYLTSDALILPSNTNLIGAGWNSIIKSVALASGGAGIGQRQVDASGSTNYRIANLALDCSGITAFLAGVRNVLNNGSSNFLIEDCYFKTPGAATASPGASFFRITGNTAVFSSTNGIDNGDGIYDQWGGAHDFTVDGNIANGNGIAHYPIIVTGQNTNLSAGACYNFAITGNVITNANQVGIWINGRNGVNTNFSVTGNIINGVTNFYGVAVTDCNQFSVTGNTTQNTGTIGLYLSEEATFANGCNHYTATGNVITNANVLAAAGASGVAIGVTVAGSNGSLTGNCVKGTTHTYAVYLDGPITGVEVIGGNYAAGTLGIISNNNGANKILTPSPPSTGWGTPTGNGVIINFPGATATTAQCAQVIAQLIVLMKKLGVLTV